MFGVCVGWDLLFNLNVHTYLLPRSLARPLGPQGGWPAFAR